MAEFNGNCARQAGLRSNPTENLFCLFTDQIERLYSSSHDTMESFFAVRASMFKDGVTGTDLEAKAMELQSLVARLEAKGEELEALLNQIDAVAIGRLVRALPTYRHLTESEATAMVVEYCEDVRLMFCWMAPESLAVKRQMITGTLLQTMSSRKEVC